MPSRADEEPVEIAPLPKMLGIRADSSILTLSLIAEVLMQPTPIHEVNLIPCSALDFNFTVTR